MCLASEKRGIPTFVMDDARKLLDGKFHEEEDEDEDLLTYAIGKQDLNKAFRAKSLDDLER